MADQLTVDEPPTTASGPAPGRRVPGFLVHEWTLAALFSLLAAVVMTWPAMRNPRHTLPLDFLDPALQAYEMSWAGWAVRHDPGRLWDTNAFVGERWAFAYSDTLLGYLPAGLIGSGVEAAVLRYNILFTLVFALAFFGAYALARQLGAGVAGAAVAGAAFAYAPWRWNQGAHLNILSTGGIALALAMLARGHGYSIRHGYGPERARPGWALAGWLVAAWQITLGFGIGLPFGYALALLTLVGLGWWLRRRPPFPARLLRSDIIGVVVFAGTAIAMAYPYLKVIEAYPYGSRSLDEILHFSPPLDGFLVAPGFSLLWGEAQNDIRATLAERGSWEAILLPGFFLYALAALGLLLSVWSRRHRLLLALALVGTFSLAMGLRAPISTPYYLLHEYLPGWNGIRTPGRLVVWMTLLLGLLAAGGVTAVTERFSRRGGDGAADDGGTGDGEVRGGAVGGRRVGGRAVIALAAVLPVGLVLAEGAQAMPFQTVPKPPPALASVEGPVLVLPANSIDDLVTMLWSTETFVPLANGATGFAPEGHLRMWELTKSFPDAASVDFLRGRGIRTVLVLRQPPTATAVNPPQAPQVPERALTATGEGLGLTREERPDAVVFHLQP